MMSGRCPPGVVKLNGNNGFTLKMGKDIAATNKKMPGEFIILTRVIDPLNEQCNDNCNFIRFIVLLSPTCPL
jgi:hypothetical protein